MVMSFVGKDQTDCVYCETEKVIRYQEIPNDAVPATVEYEENLWRVVQICKALPTVHRMDWSTFSFFLDSLDPWENDLLRNTRMNVDPRLAVLELQNNFLAGSDPQSSKHKVPSVGLLVSGERIATGNGPSRGATVDSYRAECSGSWSMGLCSTKYTSYLEVWKTNRKDVYFLQSDG